MTPGSRRKKHELDKIIAACLGLHVEASTATETFTPGQTATIKLEAINRSNIPVTLQEARFPNTGDSNKIDAALPSNELVTKDLSCRIPDECSVFAAILASQTRERSAPSLSTIKSLSVCPKIPLLFR